MPERLDDPRIDDERDASPPDIIQQLEEGKCLEQKNEHCQQNGKIKKELSESVQVHQSGEAPA